MVIGLYTITYNVDDNAGNDATEITRTVNVVDTIAPIQTSVSVTPLNGSVSVKLNTQESATVTLSYGFTTAYGSSADVTTVANNSHDKTILGLSPCTDYHYSIVATDIHGNVSSSSDGQFKTFGVGTCPGDSNSGSSSQG
jgi:chitodextrinase